MTHFQVNIKALLSIVFHFHFKTFEYKSERFATMLQFFPQPFKTLQLNTLYNHLVFSDYPPVVSA